MRHVVRRGMIGTPKLCTHQSVEDVVGAAIVICFKPTNKKRRRGWEINWQTKHDELSHTNLLQLSDCWHVSMD